MVFMIQSPELCGSACLHARYTCNHIYSGCTTRAATTSDSQNVHACCMYRVQKHVQVWVHSSFVLEYELEPYTLKCCMCVWIWHRKLCICASVHVCKCLTSASSVRTEDAELKRRLVCTCIYTYAHMYIHVHTYIHVYTYIHIYLPKWSAYIPTYIHNIHRYIHAPNIFLRTCSITDVSPRVNSTWNTPRQTDIHQHTHMYIHIHMYTHTHIYIHMNTYVHTYNTYMYIHTYTHTNTFLHTYPLTRHDNSYLLLPPATSSWHIPRQTNIHTMARTRVGLAAAAASSRVTASCLRGINPPGFLSHVGPLDQANVSQPASPRALVGTA